MQRLLILLTMSLLTLWLVKPEAIKQLSTLGKTKLQNEAPQLISQAQKRLSNFLEQKGQQVLGSVFEKQFSGVELAVVNDITDKEAEVIIIDFLTGKNQSLKFKKNQIYYLDLRNIPVDLCVFINHMPKKVKPSQYLQVSFSKSGIFDLYFDECSNKSANFSEIIVE